MGAGGRSYDLRMIMELMRYFIDHVHSRSPEVADGIIFDQILKKGDAPLCEMGDSPHGGFRVATPRATADIRETQGEVKGETPPCEQADYETPRGSSRRSHHWSNF